MHFWSECTCHIIGYQISVGILGESSCHTFKNSLQPLFVSLSDVLKPRRGSKTRSKPSSEWLHGEDHSCAGRMRWRQTSDEDVSNKPLRRTSTPAACALLWTKCASFTSGFRSCPVKATIQKLKWLPRGPFSTREKRESGMGPNTTHQGTWIDRSTDRSKQPSAPWQKTLQKTLRSQHNWLLIPRPFLSACRGKHHEAPVFQ